jgi:signal transduction histidine kinase
MTRKIMSRIELKNPGNNQTPVQDDETDTESLEKITHDIRSSINIIIGYAQLMLDETTGKINKTQRRALQDILNSTNKLNHLTNVLSRRLDTESGE